MKRMLTTTLAAVALAATLGAPLSAQDAQLSGTITETFGRQAVVTTPEGRLLVTLPDGAEMPATGARVDMAGTRDGETFAATSLTVAPPATNDTAAAPGSDAALPPALRGLGLTEIRSRPDDDGEIHIYARLPEGGGLRAESRGDQLIEVQADSALPAALVAALLPEAVRAEPRLSDLPRLTEIDLDDRDEIEIEGYAADGMRVEMEFDRTGTLRDYELERDDRRSLSGEDARARLEALGYTGIGFIERGGRHVDAIATNPDGEQVEVRLDDQGRVDRERMWMR